MIADGRQRTLLRRKRNWDGAAAPVDMSGPGGRLYQRGEEALQEARLGLSDLQELAYGAAESAGENHCTGPCKSRAAAGRTGFAQRRWRHRGQRSGRTRAPGNRC